MKKRVLITALLLSVLVTFYPPAYAQAASQYIWPTTTHTLSRNFYNHSSKAIDISVPAGTEVVASREGTVWAKYTGCINFSGRSGSNCRVKGCHPSHNFFDNYCNNGFGNGVIIKHSDGTFESYAHMSTVDVSNGQYVSQGQRLGTSGSAGNSSGPHLHIEIRSGNAFKGTVLNPEKLFNGSSTVDTPRVTVITSTADTLTETSAILRGSFQVINGRASECGMYLGTSANDTPWLGSDTVNTTGTSMFYSTSKYGRTLQPGTTYWYKAYAIVNGTKYCGELKSFTTPGTAPVEGNLSINRSHMTMKVGTCDQITATTTPAGQPVSWESTNPDVATVSNGIITANKPGTTTINVSMNYGGSSYLSLCSVTVEAAAPAVEGNLSINKSHMTMKVGTCDQITATTTPVGQAVSWESTNPDVATVSNGVVTANKPGTTTINVSMNYGGTYYLSLCSVTVEAAAPPVESTPAVDLSVSGVTNLSQNSARVNASCSYRNGDRPNAVGLYLGTSSSAMSFYKSDEGINHNKNPFDIWYNLSGLSAGTTYYYQFYATVGNKTVWSSVNSFTTTAAPVQVSNTRSAVVVNTNGQYLAINNAPAASPKYSQQIGRIPPGGTVTVYPDKTSGNWYYVEYNGVSGYAYNKYLALQ